MLEYAQWSVLSSLGLSPALFCGHSLGEIIGLCISGILAPEVAWYIMVNLAISTHRKAVGKAISKIGEAYLQLQAQQKIVEAQKELLPLGKELVDYWQKVESVDGRQGVSLNLAIQHQRELELRLEQTRMKEIMPGA